jgi:hypothetical protein
MWPFRKRVFRKLRSTRDYCVAVRALVMGSFTSEDAMKGQIESLARSGSVLQVIAGEKEGDSTDRLYLRAVDELAAKPAAAVPAMCHILLNVTGPDKAWALIVLDRVGPRAVPHVCAQLRVSAGKMRRHLIRVLERVGDRSAAAVLDEVGREDGEIGEAARKAAAVLRDRA